MKLSRTVVYAVQATLQLAEVNSQTPIPCKRLASDGRMPERFLLQILRNLVKHGILQSTRGVEGGYSFDRSVEEISLLDVMEAVDEPFVAELSREAPTDAGHHQTRLQEALDSVAASTRRQLAAIRIVDLLPREKLAKPA